MSGTRGRGTTFSNGVADIPTWHHMETLGGRRQNPNRQFRANFDPISSQFGASFEPISTQIRPKTQFRANFGPMSTQSHKESSKATTCPPQEVMGATALGCFGGGGSRARVGDPFAQGKFQVCAGILWLQYGQTPRMWHPRHCPRKHEGSGMIAPSVMARTFGSQCFGEPMRPSL